jgi:hypothetical protein
MCGWGTDGADGWFCCNHVTEEQRSNGLSWMKAWDEGVVADMRAKRGLFEAGRSWLDRKGGRVAAPPRL